VTRIAIAVALLLLIICLWAQTPSSAQTPQNNRGSDPPPPTQQQQQQPRDRPRDVGRDHVTVTVSHIPTFMQAGRTYVFEPVGGKEFSGRVVSLDSTGWVQVQLRPGPDVGPLAEWFNLANMTSVKAMN
jgi:hypothetical protein